MVMPNVNECPCFMLKMFPLGWLLRWLRHQSHAGPFMSTVKAVPISGCVLLFPCRRLILCLSIDFLNHHTQRAFAFYLSEPDVSEKTTDKQQRPTVLNKPANDFHHANHSVCWLRIQAHQAVLTSKAGAFHIFHSLHWTELLNGNKRCS